MTHDWILVFSFVGFLSIVGALVIIGFQIKDSIWWKRRDREWPKMGGRRPPGSMRTSTVRFSTINILFAAASVCNLLTQRWTLFWALMTLVFLGMAGIAIHAQRLRRYLRGKLFGQGRKASRVPVT